MDIELYNTLSGKKEVFKPVKAGKVTLYQCGPTVYDRVHIGNLRTFLLGDVVRRVFEYNGYTVDQVMNITDVDDKTIKKSLEQKKPLSEVTQKYEDFFLEDIASLNILFPKKLPRATENVSAMIDMISDLIEKGVAYKAADGIYFSIEKSAHYGALAKLKIKEASSQERIANDEYDKENPRDFAVWKFHTKEDGDVSFDAPFGKGRPGWHIECSAMSINELGETLDIHIGGSDLIFPHHTNEIAQSEAFTGKPFVHYWLHGAFMNVNDTKMAKSKGNFLKLEDLMNEQIAPLSFRYWLFTAHYRTQVNFTFEALSSAQTAFVRFMQQFMELGGTTGKVDGEYKKKFMALVNNDLEMPQAIALSHELLKDKKVSKEDKRATLLDFDNVFGFNLASMETAVDETVPAEIAVLVDAREEARKEKDFEKADALRKEIEQRGYEVKDTDKGPTVIRI